MTCTTKHGQNHTEINQTYTSDQIGENEKNIINIITVINGKINLTAFFPITIGIEVNKPSHAFLEKVKNAAIPVDIRKPKAAVFLNKLLPLSRNNAIQNGQTKLKSLIVMQTTIKVVVIFYLLIIMNMMMY